MTLLLHLPPQVLRFAFLLAMAMIGQVLLSSGLAWLATRGWTR